MAIKFRLLKWVNGYDDNPWNHSHLTKESFWTKIMTLSRLKEKFNHNTLLHENNFFSYTKKIVHSLSSNDHIVLPQEGATFHIRL